MMSRGFLLSLAGILVVAAWYVWAQHWQRQHSRRLGWLVYGSGIALYFVALLTSLWTYLAGEGDPLSLVMVAVLGLVTVGVGTGNLYQLALKQRVERIELQLLRRRFPESPWRWDRRWQDGRIMYSNKGDVIFGAALTVLINGGLFAAYAARRDQIREQLNEDPWGNLCIYYVFLMGGLFALRYAVNALMKWKRYGMASFEMKTIPGTIGGCIEGEIETRFREVPHAGFDLSLSCIEMDVSFKRALNWIPETLLWEAVRKVRIEDLRMGRHGITFAVRFAIPEGLEETDTSSPTRRIAWVLRASAFVDSQPFSAAFRVPVFRAAGSAHGPNGPDDMALRSGMDRPGNSVQRH